MAPIRPRPRKPHSSSNTLLPTTTNPLSPNPPITNPINPHTHPPTKILKRRTKHSALLSRLHANHPPKTNSRTTTKARRPRKKTPLTTTLTDLGDALPDACEGGEWEGFADGMVGGTGVKKKSLGTGRGAMRKREMAMVGERERFVRNLGVLVAGRGGGEGLEEGGGEGEGGGGKGTGKGGSSERWMAIRRFIEGSAEGGG